MSVDAHPRAEEQAAETPQPDIPVVCAVASTECPSSLPVCKKLNVTVSVEYGLTYVTVQGFRRFCAESSLYGDVRHAVVSNLGSALLQDRVLRGYKGPDDSDVLIRYRNLLAAGRFHPTGRLQSRTLFLVEPDRCSCCRRAILSKKRCATPEGFTPRLSTCGDADRAECPRSFTIGGARYTKDFRNHSITNSDIESFVLRARESAAAAALTSNPVVYATGVHSVTSLRLIRVGLI
jgi:hypothetical protein